MIHFAPDTPAPTTPAALLVDAAGLRSASGVGDDVGRLRFASGVGRV